MRVVCGVCEYVYICGFCVSLKAAPAGGAGAGGGGKEVFVAGLPYAVTEDDIKAHFADCGEITCVAPVPLLTCRISEIIHGVV